MKTLFLLVFFCCTTVLSFAQCGITTFSDQNSIDNFHTNYPGCTTLGNVTISGPDITDLDGLSGITGVNRFTITNNPALTSLAGLSSLVNVLGYLTISANPLLPTLEGLNAVKNVGPILLIQGNNTLTSISALHLIGSGDYTPDEIIIDNNKALVNLKGFEGINQFFTISKFTISNNSTLVNLEGLEKIGYLSTLIINNNSNLLSVHGLENTSNIYSLSITNNTKLLEIDALSKLNAIHDFKIVNNPALNSLQGLRALTSLDQFRIDNNDMLKSLAGLENITNVNIVYIVNNSQLSTCSVESMCKFLTTTSRRGNIGNNKAGCNSAEEIIAACEAAAPGAGSFRINSGGAAYTASSTQIFSADQYFTGTTQISNAAEGNILNTADDQLYKEQRFGSSFSYNIPVKNSPYQVVLHFAEIYWGVPAKGGSAGTGKRRFHVNMEGSRKLTNYDIFTSAGAAMRAWTETFAVNVTDGTLNIDFLSGSADKPIVAAIEVLPVPVILAPLADAYVRNTPYDATNYGSASTLEVKAGSLPDYQRNTYLKFPLTGVSQVGSAKLRVYGSNIQNGINTTVSAFGVSNDSWTETGITWLNAPATSGGVLGSVEIGAQAYYEIDVTSFVKSQLTGDRTVSLLVTNPADQNRQLTFNSRENAANPPQLVVFAVSAAPAARIGSELDIIQSEIKTEPQVSAIYPNPAGKRFNVYISKAHEGRIDLQLINLAGSTQPLSTAQPVLTASNVEVDVSSMKLPVGMYMIKIQSTTLTETVKVLLIEQ